MRGQKKQTKLGFLLIKDELLVRFWFSRIGRQWDAVWSELCAACRRRPALLRGIRDYIARSKQSIQTVEGVADGDCWTDMGCNLGYRHVFFVCPRSGLLKVRPRRVAKR